ncbi:MAG TPA: hypothetical protein ENN97_10555 [Phycisphaerales bacterium]|nr:hypothetical protein [Phycisphaerales bacterium]
MKNNIVIIVLSIVVIVQAVLWRQTTQRLNSMANVTEWPEPLSEKTIVVDGMTYPDPVIRYAPDAVFPKISARIAKDFMPDFVVYTNDQLKYTSELIAQAHWYHRHLKIALNLLEAERGLSQLPVQCAITPYAINVQTEFGEDDAVNNYRIKGQGSLTDIRLRSN